MKIERAPTHVIFDLDGVLLDTERLYTAATQIVVGRYGKRYGWEVKVDLMGRAELESAALLIERLGLPMTPAEYLAARAAELEPLVAQCEPMEGAPELLALLQQRGVSHGIATSSSRRWFERKTVRHEWIRAVPVVVCGDDADVARPKPDPSVFLAAARRLGAEPRDCLVFEDSAAGVAAGVAAGMQVVALVDPNLRLEAVPGADLYVRGFDEFRLDDLGL